MVRKVQTDRSIEQKVIIEGCFIFSVQLWDIYSSRQKTQWTSIELEEACKIALKPKKFIKEPLKWHLYALLKRKVKLKNKT